MENFGASANEIKEVLGRGRARKGIFEGDLSEGELEIGQIASQVESIISAKQVIKNMVDEYNESVSQLSDLKI